MFIVKNVLFLCPVFAFYNYFFYNLPAFKVAKESFQWMSTERFNQNAKMDILKGCYIRRQESGVALIF